MILAHPTDRQPVLGQAPTGMHLFRSGAGNFVLDVESGMIHTLPEAYAKSLEDVLRLGDPIRGEMMAMAMGLITPAPDQAAPPKTVPLRALSLAVAQKCNLGCTYCYAQQGSFGGNAASMALDVAKASVERLFANTQPGETVTLAFMGGEPLINRTTLHAATRHAAQQTSLHQTKVRFTITTNGTLLLPEDIDLFQEYRFTITVSIDGLGRLHDRQRPFFSGKGSFDRVLANVSRLLSLPERSYRVLARVTVTPENLELPDIMTGLLDMGFDGIMFSPMLCAPSGEVEMQAENLDKFLEQLKQCGELFAEGLRQGKILPLTNVLETLRRIHRRSRDQYPCGAGGGYMAAAADGNLYACHRFVNDESGRMGSINEGIDAHQQSEWLNERHLKNQLPCTSCWARNLCSGSCHYEVIKRGRPACDYIRGWLDYCLKLYAHTSRYHPEDLEKIIGTD
jgi:uncharacterized protein